MNTVLSTNIFSGRSRRLSPSHKARLAETLGRLLQEVFRMRVEGAPQSEQRRARDHADSYMHQLEGTGAFSQKELLDVVAQARNGALGPATRTVSDVQDADFQAGAA